MPRISLAPLAALAVLVACGGDKAPADDTAATDSADSGVDSAGDSDTGADSDTDSGEDTDPVDVPADNVATALGDCYGYYRTPDEYPNQLAAGHELQRYTLHEPEAVCNDGTRAVMYVRAATDPDLDDVWSIHLQGGGSCGSYLGCAQRWCGVGYYDSSKMSSANLPLEIAGVGIYDAEGANVLAGANQVHFYYCSSDSWRGVGSAAYDADDIEVDGADPDDLPFELPPYTMFRRGHTILEAGLDELAAGVVADGGETLPSLDDATLVVFNGTSGGSGGARTNADWVRERLAARGTSVLAVFDAANNPSGDFWDPAYDAIYQERIALGWAQTVASETPLPFTDSSCLATLGGTADEWLCWQPDYLVLHHITTPFFVRQDLRDISDASEATGIPEDEYEAAVVEMLTAIHDVQATGTEGGDLPRAPGVYGPNCAQHVALESTTWWMEATVRDSTDTPRSFHDAVFAWAQGMDVAILDAPLPGEGNGPRSDCAKVDDER